MEDKAVHFVVCLDNSDYPASLEVGKLYRIIPDDEAAAEGYLRFVDESGGDYAFLANRFHPVPLPPPSNRRCWPLQLSEHHCQRQRASAGESIKPGAERSETEL